jgi:hypothetical protein
MPSHGEILGIVLLLFKHCREHHARIQCWELDQIIVEACTGNLFALWTLLLPCGFTSSPPPAPHPTLQYALSIYGRRIWVRDLRRPIKVSIKVGGVYHGSFRVGGVYTVSGYPAFSANQNT